MVTQPASWRLAMLRRRRARMTEEKLDLSTPVAFASCEEQAAPIACFNAALRAEESGLRQGSGRAAAERENLMVAAY